MFYQSGVEQLMCAPEFNEYCLFADQGYQTYGHVVSPFSGRQLTEEESEFNRSMILPRLRVEHGFMRVTQLFPIFFRATALKYRQTPVAQLYNAVVFFTNLRTCMDGGNLVSDYFSCPPPTASTFLM